MEKVSNKMKDYECLCHAGCNSHLLKELKEEGIHRTSDCLNPTSPPTWFNVDKLRRGQSLFRKHFLSIIVSNLVGLLSILSYESIVQALVFTGRSSTAKATFKRYLSTINHIRRWYSEDVFDPNTSASRSIQLVRRMHTRSHNDARKAQAAYPSQTDMVVTQWAFFGLIITHGEQLGIKCNAEEEEAIIHFWKCIGYLMGIEDRFNLAFGSLDEVRANCQALVHRVIVPSIKEPPLISESMADAMLDGIHMIVPVVDPPAFKLFTTNLLGIEKDQKQNLSLYSSFILQLMIWNFESALHLPVLGTFLRNFENGLLIFALYVCNLLPVISSYFTACKKYIIAIWISIITVIPESIKVLLTKIGS